MALLGPGQDASGMGAPLWQSILGIRHDTPACQPNPKISAARGCRLFVQNCLRPLGPRCLSFSIPGGRLSLLNQRAHPLMPAFSASARAGRSCASGASARGFPFLIVFLLTDMSVGLPLTRVMLNAAVSHAQAPHYGPTTLVAVSCSLRSVPLGAARKNDSAGYLCRF